MRNLLTILICVIASYASAQSGADKNYLPVFVPPSPEASSLGQYGDQPVGYYTGIPQINIPLFEISSGRIKVPISLSYHAGGIKVEQIASRVGLGWSLNAGGVVSRTVAGYADNKLIPNAQGLSDLVGYFHTAGIGLSDLVSMDSDGDLYDAEPDPHFYSLPGRSGKFYFQKNGIDYILPNKEDIKINTHSPYDQGYFEIITEDGLVHKFEAIETTFSLGGYNSLNYEYISSWYLTEISDPTSGKSVTFTYTTNPANLIGDKISSKTYSGNGCFGYIPSGTSISSSTTANVKVLSRIDYENGYIIFENTSPNYREDLDNDYAYTGIKKYNSEGELEKGYSFGTSYVHESGNTNLEAKRLFLNSISEISSSNTTEERYSFGYKTPALLPPRDSKEQDIWGYYNDNDALSFDPAIYVSSGNFGKTRYSVFSGGGRTLLHAGASREPDPTLLDIGTLNKITYPTGGYTEFNYEPHVFGSITGGGIRIASKTNRDADGSFLGKTSYTYHSGRLPGAFPQAAIPDGNGVTTFYQNRSHLGSNTGGYVGYDMVIEEKEDEAGNNNGAIRYEYWNVPDTEPTFESGYDTDCGNLSKYSYYPFFTWESNEIQRGVLKKTSYWEKGYDETTVPTKEIIYNYEHIQHEDQTVYSGATTSIAGGGIKLGAKRKISSEKMLLKSKVEKDTDLNSNAIEKISSYTYYDEYGQEFPNGIHNLALKTSSEKTSEGHYITTEYKYPFNFEATTSNGIMGQMVDMHYVAPVVQKITSVNSQTISSEVTNYADFGVSDPRLHPAIIYATDLTTPGSIPALTDPSSPGNDYEARLEYKEYFEGKPILIKYNDHWLKLSWSTSGKLLSKQVIESESAYTFLFPTQGWNKIEDTEARLGIYSYKYSATITFPNLFLANQGNNYIPYHISFWAKNGFFRLRCTEGLASISSTAPSDWTYYSFEIGGEEWEGGLEFFATTTDVKVNDVKLYAGNAMITTYYYDKFDRLQSISDPSGKVITYEYDEFGRLYQISDNDKNIVQSTEYNYYDEN